MNKASYNLFIEMLEELNRFIVNEYNKEYKMDVRAIGGFSMIIHKRLGNLEGPREESRDIDSLTLDYPPEITAKIKEIGKAHGMDDADGWLNNHWNRTKKYKEEFELFIQWQKLENVNMSNINIYYADLEALFMFKIRAIDDRIHLAHLEPREQDVIDVVSILRAFHIDDIDEIKNELLKNTIKYFPYAVNYLIDCGVVNGNKIKI
ncbi:hypothetical protein SAMN04487934_12310 [Eubacterium ruminantium]|nr:hypothetical protein SAMN04487934_12310 [Eubacterium ruminantium]